jgi:multiple antibiotic resistance protein
MDSVGTLPIFVSLTKDLEASERNRTVRLANFTALGLSLAFVALGKVIFLLLDIKVADFLVAGGIILLVLAIKDLVTGKMIEAQGSPSEMMTGVVPLGTPLIVGPAVLTTLLVLVDQYHIIVVIGALILNLAITWILLNQANRIIGFLGKAGIGAASKVVMLLLAAIAVKMIRQGVVQILG